MELLPDVALRTIAGFLSPYDRIALKVACRNLCRVIKAPDRVQCLMFTESVMTVSPMDIDNYGYLTVLGGDGCRSYSGHASQWVSVLRDVYAVMVIVETGSLSADLYRALSKTAASCQKLVIRSNAQAPSDEMEMENFYAFVERFQPEEIHVKLSGVGHHRLARFPEFGVTFFGLHSVKRAKKISMDEAILTSLRCLRQLSATEIDLSTDRANTFDVISFIEEFISRKRTLKRVAIRITSHDSAAEIAEGLIQCIDGLQSQPVMGRRSVIGKEFQMRGVLIKVIPNGAFPVTVLLDPTFDPVCRLFR